MVAGPRGRERLPCLAYPSGLTASVRGSSATARESLGQAIQLYPRPTQPGPVWNGHWAPEWMTTEGPVKRTSAARTPSWALLAIDRSPGSAAVISRADAAAGQGADGRGRCAGYRQAGQPPPVPRRRPARRAPGSSAGRRPRRGPDPPQIAQRVTNPANPVAEEHPGHIRHRGSTGILCPRVRGPSVSATYTRRKAGVSGQPSAASNIITHRVADSHLGVPDAPIRPGNPAQLHGAGGCLGEVDQPGGIPARDDPRCHGRVAGRCSRVRHEARLGTKG